MIFTLHSIVSLFKAQNLRLPFYRCAEFRQALDQQTLVFVRGEISA